MKIHHKIIYLLTGIFIIYTLLFSGFIYYSISNYSFADFYKRLEIRAAITAKIELENPLDVGSIKDVNHNYLEVLPNQKEYILPIKNQEADYTGHPELPKEFIEGIIKNGTGTYNQESQLYAGIKYSSNDIEEYVVIVSAENYFYSHHIAYLKNLLFTSLAFGVLIILVLAWIFSRTLIQPITNMVQEVEKISSENLHLRLNISKKNDSIKHLGVTFNNMLNRLETSFETQKNFISNASHELNTPLTSIIGEADLALSREREKIDYQIALEKILVQAENLSKKTKALLLLAQTGFDGRSQRFEKIRIDQLILDVQETVQKVVSHANIQIDFSLLPENPTKLKIKGNNQLLHLALYNIIENGCKYSNGQNVSIALAATDHEVVIIIKDKGIGIPKNEMQFIYDPYFRATNTKEYYGYGIGLPLSRNIILLHNGTLTVSSVEDQGTTVQINLPLGGYHL